jgi:hypothetical protein
MITVLLLPPSYHYLEFFSRKSMESGAGIIVLESKRSLSNILTKHKHLKNIKEKAGKPH